MGTDIRKILAYGLEIGCKLRQECGKMTEVNEGCGKTEQVGNGTSVRIWDIKVGLRPTSKIKWK